jgi:hypothetical protein
MHKSATKCNETIDKWCKNKHGASKIIDTFETYQWCMREEEEDIPLIKELGAVRVANGMKQCAWVSSAWTRRHGEPMKRCA